MFSLTICGIFSYTHKLVVPYINISKVNTSRVYYDYYSLIANENGYNKPVLADFSSSLYSDTNIFI